MPFDVSPAWSKIHGLANAFLALLPNLLIAIIVLAILWLIARWTKSLIISVYSHRRYHLNLGLVLGRLVQALLMLIVS